MAIHFIFIFCFSTSIAFCSASPALVFNLIHPRKINPLELSNVSRIKETSIARLQYLQAKASGDVIAHLSPNNFPPGFLVNVSIGNPPKIQLLDMDTGSDLTWLQCLPCPNCYDQYLPIFNPSKSSTYRNEFDSCMSSRYQTLEFNAKTKSCEYSMTYMDGSKSRGILVKETLTFSTIYGESSLASLPNVVVGCGHNNYGGIHIGSGIFGLGFGRFSLVHRFGSKFSYCFGSIDDTSNPNNVLVIGDTGNIMGDATPLRIDNGMYYVTLEGISVDGTLLPINQHVFQRNYHAGSGGTIIDTGTSFTWLVEEAYDQLKSKIEDIFGGKFRNAYVDDTTCYYGDFERDLVDSGFPDVAFHFSDGAELSLDVKSIFMKYTIDGIFCLTVTPNHLDDMNIIGAMAQQNYNVGFDLKQKQVSFERIDCGVLFDY